MFSWSYVQNLIRTDVSSQTKISERKWKFWYKDTNVVQSDEISVEICYNETKYWHHFEWGELLIIFS